MARNAAMTYDGKSLRPGGGGRFARMKDRLESEGKSPESADRIAAAIGRRKYGARRMARMAAAHR